jgi:hypothetical protein
MLQGYIDKIELAKKNFNKMKLSLRAIVAICHLISVSSFVPFLAVSTSKWFSSRADGVAEVASRRNSVGGSDDTVVDSSEASSSANSAGTELDGVTPKVAFRPKQSLGQNYLSDQNYVLKICNALGDGGPPAGRAEALEIASDNNGQRVVELGPGAGALSRVD